MRRCRGRRGVERARMNRLRRQDANEGGAARPLGVPAARCWRARAPRLRSGARAGAARPRGNPDHPTATGRAQEWPVSAIHPAVRAEFVPYPTFPGAGRRGTTVIDRSTAYPLFGLRAGRRALDLVRDGTDRHRARPGRQRSRLRARAARRRRAPLVFNPQGLEEFGASQPERRAARSAPPTCRCGGRCCTAPPRPTP